VIAPPHYVYFTLPGGAMHATDEVDRHDRVRAGGYRAFCGLAVEASDRPGVTFASGGYRDDGLMCRECAETVEGLLDRYVRKVNGAEYGARVARRRKELAASHESKAKKEER
jgi:hypothetical protein